jgi:hypothetical protein
MVPLEKTPLYAADSYPVGFELPDTIPIHTDQGLESVLVPSSQYDRVEPRKLLQLRWRVTSVLRKDSS